MTGDTLVLRASDVTRLLPIAGCIDAVASALKSHEAGKGLGPASSGLTLPDGSVHAKMAGLAFEDRLFIVVKANVNLPGNQERHRRPTIQGALLLLDGRDGRPLAVMDSIVLTNIRTAAVAALAARHLAVPDARVLVIVGCGAQGEAQLRAMLAVRPLREVLVHDRDVTKAEAFARRMASETGVPVHATGTLGDALSRADICVTCTTSTTPIVFEEHVRPGLLVAAVGADNPTKQEIDARAMARARVVVDSLTACSAGGDLHHALGQGVMAASDVHGELSAVVAGRVPGRTTADEIFVFDSTGTALQDVAAAVLVYQQAQAQGVGLRVTLDDRFRE